jgi:hypothetical protein
MARPAADVLERAPRGASQHAFGRRELRSILFDALRMAAPAVITHTIGAARHGSGPRTRGLTFLALASHQLAHALRLGSERSTADLEDRSVELGVGGSYLLLAAPFMLPALRRTLRISPPRPFEAAMIVGLSLLPLGLRLLAPARAAGVQTRPWRTPPPASR